MEPLPLILLVQKLPIGREKRVFIGEGGELRKDYVLKKKVFKMIKLISSNSKKYELFQDYHQLCDYINKAEMLKGLRSDKTVWRFTYRKYETLSFLYHRAPSLMEFCTPIEKEALDKKLGLIEIVKGDEKNITQILLNRSTYKESIKRDWCHEYCKEHGLTISEMVSKNHNFYEVKI